MLDAGSQEPEVFMTKGVPAACTLSRTERRQRGDVRGVMGSRASRGTIHKELLPMEICVLGMYGV